ncbi:MAG: LPS export ABC transporter periplasmic protein LptC [Cyanobacteria bacterium P01_A01_bin.83]
MSLAKLNPNRLNILIALLILSIVGCQSSIPESQPEPREARSDTQLVLNNAVLEQSNKQDNTIWKIKADNIVYSEDKQIATLNRVVGNLWQNGTIILKVSAKIGEVRDNGNIILLNQDIVASDPRNNSVINTDAVEWRPQENLLLIKEELVGTHPNLKVTGDSGTYLTDIEQLAIQGNVVGITNQPALELTSDRLEWNIAQNKLKSPGAVELVRYQEDQTITEQLVGDRAEVDLVEHTATLNQNIELITLEPQLQIATDFFVWNYQQRSGQTDRPIQIWDRDRQINLTGNQGEINLPRAVATLKEGVKGINQQKASQLYARQLTWNMEAEEVEATGNVIYEQADPQARLTGDKAVGQLSNNNIVVTGSGQQQVQTVIDN